MHRRFRIPRAIFPRGRLSAGSPSLASSSFSLLLSLPFFFLVSVLSIIDSRARCAAPSTSFSRCNGAEATRNRRTRYQFRPHFAPPLPRRPRDRSYPGPSLLVTLFFYQFSRANPFCALHLLITNDKFALRLHWRDKTEANSRCRKCTLGHDASCLPLAAPSRSPRPQLQKYIGAHFRRTREFNLILMSILRELKRWSSGVCSGKIHLEGQDDVSTQLSWEYTAELKNIFLSAVIWDKPMCWNNRWLLK